MRLSWNEIRQRAAAFSRDWAGQGYEKGQTQLFYRDFFEVFGVPVRRVASFEEPVRKLGNKRGFIDLFWKGVLLVEQKIAGKDLKIAKDQALQYFPGLKDDELPRYVLVSDFQTFELYDLDDDDELKFNLADLHKHVDKLGFITGVKKRSFQDEDPVNIKASEIMGTIHDALEDSGYTGQDLERFLVRLVFCLFADDTGIFEPRGIFEEFIENRTREDGSDLSGRLAQLFQTLDTDKPSRASTLDADLAEFPYINGDLFSQTLRLPSFTSSMRESLLSACRFDWSQISPAIFGSLFQSVMNREERRDQGAHYTNEANILKVIQPLFLDELHNEFQKLKASKGSRRKSELIKFQIKLSQIKCFDPACGCGNFLIIAYRELRKLELEVIRELIDYDRNQSGEFNLKLDTSHLSLVDVSQFYGIEIGEFPARIAETAIWMMDHIMNNNLSYEFSSNYARIPLKSSPTIVVNNALDVDWNSVIDAKDCTYVFGNPPFRGHQYRNTEQQRDMARVWGTSGQVNRLDYVTCWFKKALDYTSKNRNIDIGFVATNSIAQGEQSGILWPQIFGAGLSIFYAHRTFQWNNEARGKAAVHCVIIGLSWNSTRNKVIYEYDNIRGQPHHSDVKQINGYLIDGLQYAVPARSQTPSGRLNMHKGSQPTDGARTRNPSGGYINVSNLILDEQNKNELITREPNSAKWLRQYVGGEELLSGEYRWCLWLKNVDPTELKHSPAVQERLHRVKSGRLQSPTLSVRNFANYPTLFTQDRQPSTSYLAIPEVSSENREYIPIAILSPDIIASNQLKIIPGADLIYFGILTSTMHMAWMRAVGGRLKSDYRYAPSIYNSFPWPSMNTEQKAKLEELAQAILDARSKFSNASLDTLYDTDNMPPELRKAHTNLDNFVDKLYKKSGFKFERERVEHLFDLFRKEETPLGLELPE